MCLWKPVCTCVFYVWLCRLSCALTPHFKVILYPAKHPRVSLVWIVIFTAYYWDTLLWCDVVCRALTRPGEGVRPLNISRDVNKLSLIPGCLSYDNANTYAYVWSRTDSHMLAYFNCGWNKYTLNSELIHSWLKGSERTLISHSYNHSQKVKDSVWSNNFHSTYSAFDRYSNSVDCRADCLLSRVFC